MIPPLYQAHNYWRASARVQELCRATGLRVVTVHKYLVDPSSVDAATRQQIETAARSIGEPIGAFMLAGAYGLPALTQRREIF